MGAKVDLAYSLYDALVSINVPPDKARVVIDALERDMGTTLATKSDLQLLGQQLESRVTLFEQKVDSRFSAFEQKVDAAFVAFDHKIMALDQKIGARFVATDLKFDRLEDRIASSAADLRKDMEILRTSMTVRLGSMLVGAIGLVLAGIKLLSL